VNIKKVAYIYDGTEFGGVEIYVLNLLKHIDRTRYFPCVVIPGYNRCFSPPRFIEEVRKSGLELLSAPFPGNSRGISFAKDVWNLAQIFKKNQIDIIHIQTSNYDGGKRPILAAKLAGVKVILRTEHVPPSSNLKLYSRYIIKPFDLLTNYIITDSNSNRNEQIRLLKRDPQKVYRSYCGIELEKFIPKHNPRKAKELLGFDPELPLVGAIGRLVEQKGHKYFVDAAARVIKEIGAVNFVIVGKGKLEKELREQVSRLGIAQYFHFAGFQSNYLPYVEAMDITVMSSIHEGFSLMMLEFMAMGKPCVFTDHPSFQEAIVNEESGLLVAVESGEALAQGILKLLGNPVLANQLGKNALARVRSEFSLERLIKDMMELYDSTLGFKTYTPVEQGKIPISI